MKFNIKKLFTIFLTLSITITIFNTFITNALDNNNEVYIKQLELKNKLFIDAIDNFGATSPQEAVILYCEGVKSRSGPLQYSVMCDKLKKSFKSNMDYNKNYAWVTGVSSPSVSDYKVIDIKKIDSKTYVFKVKFSLEYALKPIGYTYTSLKVEKFDNKWCITNIKESYY